MATFSKRSGGWRVQVAIKGVRESGTFSTKAEAAAWAAERETALRANAKTGLVSGKTVQHAFEKYESTVSIHKKGYRWESIRLAKLAREKIKGIELGKLLLVDITPATLGLWRDQRLGVDQVSGSTVNREMNLLSHVFATAHKEWRWIAENPTKGVTRPKESAPRDRLISQDEIDRLSLALRFNNEMVTTKVGRVGIAFLFAIETAMRAGEICSLIPSDIKGAVAALRDTKNGDRRNVPLSKRSIELLSFLPPNEDTVFDLSAPSLDVLFRKARDRCEIHDLTFHDTRHEAITRLAKKLNVLDLARMVGHKNLNQLQTYYNESAESIAAKLG